MPLGTFFGFAPFIFTPNLRPLPAFCTTLPFQFGRRCVIFQVQLLTFSPKKPLFNGNFALFGHIFSGSKRLCLYKYGVFLCLSSCIQPYFTLRLAPKCTAFSTISPCIQHQNALRLAPKCTTFSTKTQYIQQHIALHLVANSPKTGANNDFIK